MLRHHVGSGRRAVIPSGWSAHHRAVTEGAMTATVEARRPGGTEGAMNPATGERTVTPFAPHYTGKARIQIVPMFGGDTETAGQQVTTAGYLVTVKLAGSDGWKVDDLVKVTAVDANGDPTLVGRELTVTVVARGSLAWERDLRCTDDLG